MSVLVVDDEATIRQTVSEFLRREGYAVRAAADAPSALDLHRESPADIVLSDIILPKVSGVDLLRQFRESAPSVQVIMMTGDPTVETAAEAMRSGAVDYLVKPVGRNAIARSVAHAARIKALDDERRQLAETNRAYQQDLERIVGERTQALHETNHRLESTLTELRRTEQQVIHQERMSALGQMASGIAHNFNNALMPILAFSEMLICRFKDREGEEESVRQLQMIRSAALDADGTVKRLREFYRPREAGELRDQVNLNDVVQQVVALTRPKWRDESRAKGAHVQIETDLQSVPTIAANRSELHEALTNMVFNAVDAMPAGGTLRFVTRVDGDRVRMEIEDTGIGMTDEVRQRCTVPFFTTKKERGTGLGLTVSCGIIRRHGGAIDIRSQAGKGTIVTISLPVRPGMTAAPLGKEAGLPSRSLHVLVVEDEDPVREALVACLSADGHSVTGASNGDEGLRAFETNWFDLVITDRAMPGMSGDSLSEAVKALAPGKPVILLTGFSEMMEAEGDSPAGVDLILHKPTTLDALRKAIQKVTKHGGGE